MLFYENINNIYIWSLNWLSGLLLLRVNYQAPRNLKNHFAYSWADHVYRVWISTYVQRLTGYLLGYRDWQDVYSYTKNDRICTRYSCKEVVRKCTYVQRFTRYILMYRGWKNMYSCKEIDRICTYVQRSTGYVLIYRE